MSSNTKVLTGLMERRALEAAFSELGKITNQDLLIQRAREIAEHGNAALPVLIGMLDTDDPQLRGGLGQVALRLDRNMVGPALRNAARSHDRSERARMTALTILDRYLHEPIDDAILAEMQDPRDMAQQSLQELLREMDRNPYAILEYLVQLSEQPSDIPRIILEAVPAAGPGAHLVTLLRMLAQDPDAILARGAIEQLGRVRIGEAARALADLEEVLPPELAPVAERALRKLHMSGVLPGEADSALEPWCAPPPTARTLISPVDPTGAQMVWFIGSTEADGACRLLSVIVHDSDGIIACTDLRNVAAADLPEPHQQGQVHRIVHQAGALPLQLLDASVEEGRQLLRTAIARNWQMQRPTPLRFRLCSPVIWATATTEEGAPVIGASPSETLTTGDPAHLLDHPAFAGWHWWPAGRPEPSGSAAALGAQPVESALEQFDPDLTASYIRRLQAMSRWLRLAGDMPAAELAAVAAAQLETSPVQESSFVRRLAWAGYEVAQLRHTYSRI